MRIDADTNSWDNANPYCYADTNPHSYTYTYTGRHSNAFPCSRTKHVYKTARSDR